MSLARLLSADFKGKPRAIRMWLKDREIQAPAVRRIWRI
jgi:hypothetical protein